MTYDSLRKKKIPKYYWSSRRREGKGTEHLLKEIMAVNFRIEEIWILIIKLKGHPKI